MALSNWDTLALDEKSKPTNGVFVSPAGVKVGIYKNWLYVSDKKAWRKTSRFVKPIIAEIQLGEMKYIDITVHAIRGPKEGVYCVVWAGEKIMVGCGVYGFTERGKWVGVGKREVDFLRRWVYSFEYSYMELKIPKGSKWTIDKSTEERIVYKNGKRWLQFKDYLFEDNIRQIKFDKVLRVNQGDMYFAKNVKGLSPQATPPGKSKPAHIEGIVKAMKDRDETQEPKS